MMNFFITTGLLVGQNLFAKTFAGVSHEELWSIIQTTDGGYAVAGNTYISETGGYGFLVMKLSSTGAPEWIRGSCAGTQDMAYSIIQTLDGGYAVAGYAWGGGFGGLDFLILKLSPDGSLAWTRRFGGTDHDHALSIIQTTDGGYVVAGYTDSFGAGDADILVLRLNPDGSLVWAKTFGGSDADGASSITQTTDGGYAVAGYTYSFGVDSSDVLVLKLNTDGSLAWARTYGKIGQEFGEGITRTADGGCAVAGRTRPSGPGYYDFLVLKLAPDGSLVWTKTFGGAPDDVAYSVIQTTDGGYAVAGMASSATGYVDCVIFKLNPDGSLAWSRTCRPSNVGLARSVTQTTDGGYAIGGYVDYGYNMDCFVLKLDQNGNYPDCVVDYGLTEGTPPLSTSSPSVGALCYPGVSSPVPTVTLPSLTITDVCEPLYEDVEEISHGPQPVITCSPLSGGVLFNSPGSLPIKIYSSGGRLVYSGELVKGENRILLETGVYLWQAGTHKGKAIVK